MKILYLLTCALIVSAVAFAQAPQGINYQAVVLDAGGLPLSNHSISLQLSVIDNSTSGIIVYQETQSTTTDSLGLFSVVIGSGTVVSGNFLTINWGKNNKYLKTEIDTSGGSSFVLMGTTQFMSVPYALYANKTKPTYISIEDPDGLVDLQTVVLTGNSYTVPTGKNLYVPFGYITIQGMYLSIQPTDLTTRSFPLGFSEGQTVQTNGDTTNCWLVDKTVDWITTDIMVNPITVPAGKLFIVINEATTHPLPTNFSVTIDGVRIPAIMAGTIVGEGQTLSVNSTNGFSNCYINGYYRDK